MTRAEAWTEYLLFGDKALLTKTPIEADMTEQYQCQSYFDDNNVLQDCTCGKCE